MDEDTPRHSLMPPSGPCSTRTNCSVAKSTAGRTSMNSSVALSAGTVRETCPISRPGGYSPGWSVDLVPQREDLLDVALGDRAGLDVGHAQVGVALARGSGRLPRSPPGSAATADSRSMMSRTSAESGSPTTTRPTSIGASARSRHHGLVLGDAVVRALVDRDRPLEVGYAVARSRRRRSARGPGWPAELEQALEVLVLRPGSGRSTAILGCAAAASSSFSSLVLLGERRAGGPARRRSRRPAG